MAAVGVKCERGRVSFDTCRECALSPLHPCGIAPALLKIVRGETGEKPDASAHTPSRLLGCFRQPILQQQNEYYIDVHHQKAALRGDLIHFGFEKMVEGDASIVTEKRVHYSVPTKYGPQDFSAQPDHIDILEESDGVAIIDIWDWKSREFGNELVRADTKHIAQIWMYAWLVTRTAEQWLGRNVEVVVRSVNICYIASNNQRIFTSLGGQEAIGKKGLVLALAPIPTVKPETIEKLIIRQIEAKVAARDKLPPILQGEAARWCFRCPVVVACGYYAEAKRIREDKAA